MNYLYLTSRYVVAVDQSEQARVIVYGFDPAMAPSGTSTITTRLNLLMKGVSLYSIHPNRPNIRRRIDAESAVVERTAMGIFQRIYPLSRFLTGWTSTKYFRKRNIFQSLEKPADFKKLQKRPEEMSVRYMFEAIQKQEKEGLDATRIWIDLHQKLSYPIPQCGFSFNRHTPLYPLQPQRRSVILCIWVSLVTGFIFSFIYAIGNILLGIRECSHLSWQRGAPACYSSS